jgi:hypothetical protein
MEAHWGSIGYGVSDPESLNTDFRTTESLDTRGYKYYNKLHPRITNMELL